MRWICIILYVLETFYYKYKIKKIVAAPLLDKKDISCEELATPPLISVHEYEYLEFAFISEREKAWLLEDKLYALARMVKIKLESR